MIRVLIKMYDNFFPCSMSGNVTVLFASVVGKPKPFDPTFNGPIKNR